MGASKLEPGVLKVQITLKSVKYSPLIIPKCHTKYQLSTRKIALYLLKFFSVLIEFRILNRTLLVLSAWRRSFSPHNNYLGGWEGE